VIPRPIKWLVAEDGANIFDPAAYIVEIDDEAAGEFVKVTGQSEADQGTIGVNPEDWPNLRAAIDAAVAACRDAPK
jgi:hypothetical protein